MDEESVIDVDKETEGFWGREVNLVMQVDILQQHSFIQECSDLIPKGEREEGGREGGREERTRAMRTEEREREKMNLLPRK
jgi:hypothetical protein